MNDRLYITPKDIMVLSGKSYVTAWRILNMIKDSLDKKKTQQITIDEYCNYEGVDPDEVKKALK